MLCDALSYCVFMMSMLP